MTFFGGGGLLLTAGLAAAVGVDEANATRAS